MELKLGVPVSDDYIYELLIVPYGLETFKKKMPQIALFSFNRTLWN